MNLEVIQQMKEELFTLLYSSYILSTGNRFTHNAENNEGGVFYTSRSVIVERSHFSESTADLAGAMAMKSTTILLIESQVFNNTAIIG